MKFPAVTAAVLSLALLVPALRATPDVPLMPWPARLEWREGSLPLSAGFRVRIAGHDDARLRAGVHRALDRLARRASLDFGGRFDEAAGALMIRCAGAGSPIPRLGDDESYTLAITPTRAELTAPTVVGALRGLETFLQLVTDEEGRFSVPCVEIHDAPRFPWRGLLIDVARHFQPPEVLHRNLDAMAAVKLNVLHLHLTDDQGFRVESRRHPELHAVSAEDGVLSQTQIRELIAAAADRGIRVVPEFDVPGHATSWLVSHPEIASAPGPYTLARHWGVLDPVMDPTLPETLALLRSFFAEMAELFPDAFLHIGGDENNGKHWNASARIQQFKRERGFADNEALHAWFNTQLAGILTDLGKRMVGWDEILHPDLPRDAVIHSWRGPASLTAASRADFSGILSAGYYLDLHHPAAEHYAADPLPIGHPLTDEQAARVLGGEAAMWSEWADAALFDFRVWPRAAAVAERLWSPREVADPAAMYRRLDRVSDLLAETGVQHQAWPRFEGYSDAEAAALRVFASAVEPVKRYRRSRFHKGHQELPLNELADWAASESREARTFAHELETWLAQQPQRSDPRALRATLERWHAAALAAGKMSAEGERAQGRLETARRLASVCESGGAIIRAIADRQRIDPATAEQAAAAFALASQPTAAAVEFPFLDALQKALATAVSGG